MGDKETDYFAVHVKFGRTESGEFPYKATVENRNWIIRINDFPEEPFYTLIIDEEEIVNFDTWPSDWERPESIV